jgi:hypothetical protein
LSGFLLSQKHLILTKSKENQYIDLAKQNISIAIFIYKKIIRHHIEMKIKKTESFAEEDVLLILVKCE